MQPELRYSECSGAARESALVQRVLRWLLLRNTNSVSCTQIAALVKNRARIRRESATMQLSASIECSGAVRECYNACPSCADLLRQVLVELDLILQTLVGQRGSPAALEAQFGVVLTLSQVL